MLGMILMHWRSVWFFCMNWCYTIISIFPMHFNNIGKDIGIESNIYEFFRCSTEKQTLWLRFKFEKHVQQIFRLHENKYPAKFRDIDVRWKYK